MVVTGLGGHEEYPSVAQDGCAGGAVRTEGELAGRLARHLPVECGRLFGGPEPARLGNRGAENQLLVGREGGIHRPARHVGQEFWATAARIDLVNLPVGFLRALAGKIDPATVP